MRQSIPRSSLTRRTNTRSKYKAGFLVRYSDGHEELIDIKGMLTKEFRIKQKLFEMRYMQSIKCLKLKGKQFMEV
ncbi:DUF1064 domain-containing protein [Listeria monocytogenes]|uniref:DUF1064 domain-containing protein n=1 Tax=Listeria monocytogenes TaxID=1639 RepID=UPI0010DFF7A6|nr:DUF1064 domain-containing protein [Listeria monocytogenes]EAE2871455.1 DUF1064 domain-containing protein [Listeria monocytogenes]EKL6277155.1 DUF1064 domain-containing protein [Listeria monocytogenes]MCE8274423.1 DUF1064 domain-containing protein [Listeria monocytogenes]MCP8095853.1 DUF1064 domain-containing protein [Listeria monocytogenes]MCP8194512.1 DUF1064 domain-containing protein [Listeria monocytogenes]